MARLILIASIQILLSAVYIAWFSESFGYGHRLTLLHVSIVSAAVALGAAVLGAIVRGTRSAAGLRIVRLMPALAFSLLMLLYGADALSTRHWGRNVTYDLAIQYMGKPDVLASYVPIASDWMTVVGLSVVVLATQGDAAHLTPFGHDLLAAFRRVEERTRAAIREEMAQLEADLGESKE